MLTRFIFDEDIIVGPLLFFLIIGHINYKTNIVIYGRDCQNNDIETTMILISFLLDDDLQCNQRKKGFNFYYACYILLLNHKFRYITWAKWEDVSIFL